jgi:geranylgeranyl reductase family protein
VGLAADVVVAGSGPAGASAALVLARAGARVALVDPARFPRDKACGDLLGPLGVRQLQELGIAVTGARRVGCDVVLVGPSGRRLLLPWTASHRYPAHALAAPRTVLDAALRDAALEAGAEPVTGRVAGIEEDAGGLRGVVLGDGKRVRCDAVVGADGAMSRVAAGAGLQRPERMLWGFALRWYVQAAIDRPVIVFWEPRPRRALPGYGWVFPGPDGRANVGLGVGVGRRRDRAALVGRLFPGFVAALRARGLLPGGARLMDGTRRGGWLRMGIAGTTPAGGRVLLAGDAAGLVNPLQGEGMAEALMSGTDAADAILAGPAEAADRHRRAIATRHGRFLPAAGALHAAMLARPGGISAVGRLLTAPVLGSALAAGWAIYWNDVLALAPRSRGRAVAVGLDSATSAVVQRSPVRRDALAGLR